MREDVFAEWWEDWMPACGEIPRELNDCGWRCSSCKEDFGSYLTETTGEAHYLDNPENVPTFNYCPNCGKAMRLPKLYYDVEDVRPCTVIPNTIHNNASICLEVFSTGKYEPYTI